MKKLTNKSIEIILTPKDFKNVEYINNNDCALARAIRRTLKLKSIDKISVNCDFVTTRINHQDKVYINEGFGWEVFEKVRLAYEADPKMEEFRYVTFITPKD